MIRFSHPELLWLLLCLPLLAAFSWRNGRLARRLLGQPALARLLAGWSPVRFASKELLLLVSLVFWLLAAAGPQVGTREVEVRQKGVDVVVAVDVSLSMGAQDLAPDRMARARHSIRQLLASMKGDRVALVPFAGTAFLQHPLTRDYELSGLMTDLLKPGLVPAAGTDLGAALEVALRTFREEEENDRVLVLLSDGEDFVGRWEEQLSLAEAEGVRIFTVGMASLEGAPVPDPERQGAYKQDRNGSIVLSKLDEVTLSELARRGGGVYQRSTPGGRELVKVLEAIEALEGRETGSRRYTGWQDRFSWFLLPAWLLTLLAWLLPGSARRQLMGLAFLLLVPAGVRADQVTATRQGVDAYRQGDFGGSVQAFGEALSEQESPLGHYNLGTGLYRSGDLEGAAREFRRSAEAWGADAAEEAARALANLGRVQLEQQELEEAVGSFSRALQLDPELEAARHNLEWALARMQQQQQEQQSSGDESQDQQDQEPGEDQDSGESQDQQQNPDQAEQQPSGDQQQDSGQDEPQQSPDQQQEQAEQEQQEQQQAAQPEAEAESAESGTEQAQPVRELQMDQEQLEQLLREAARRERESLERQYEALPAPRSKVEKDW